MSVSEPRVTALGARVHLFVRPEARERFISLFRDVLRCETKDLDFGLPYPILLVSFSDGSRFSVEFSDLAPEQTTEDAVDDETTFRGAWIEFRTTNVPFYQQRLREADIPEFSHPGSNHTYFSAPGGQVFRLIDISYTGPKDAAAETMALDSIGSITPNETGTRCHVTLATISTKLPSGSCRSALRLLLPVLWGG